MRFLGLALCLLLVAACGPTATAITTPTPGIAGPPLPSIGASASPMPLISVPPGSRWQLLSDADFPTVQAYYVSSVITTPAGLMAAGYAPAPGEAVYARTQGVIWTSADGGSWQAVTDPGLLYAAPQSLVALGTDLYILGDYETCSYSDQTCTDSGKAGNQLWRSSDGKTWQMLPVAADMQGAYADGMVAGHGLLLVHGSADDDAGTVTVWRSSDGTTWNSYAAPSQFDQGITAMASTPSGFVLFGTTYDIDTDTYGIGALGSADGASFSAVQLPDLSAFPNPEIDGVTSNGSSVVAVGYSEDDSGNDQVLALFSTDGTRWSVAHDTDGSFSGADMIDAVAIDRGYLAFGFRYESIDSDNLVPRVWFSPDGQAWRALADIPGAFTDLTAWGASAQAAVYFGYNENDISATDVQITLYPWYAQLDGLLAF